MLDLNLADQDLLRATLVDLRIDYRLRNGKIAVQTADTNPETLTQIKQAYAKKALVKAAKAKGFRLQIDGKNPNKLTLRR